MADAPILPDEAETRARWGAFAWTPKCDMLANTTAIIGIADVVSRERDQ